MAKTKRIKSIENDMQSSNTNVSEINKIPAISSDVYVTIEDFINPMVNLNSVEKYHYINSNKTNDLRTADDWKAITGLK